MRRNRIDCDYAIDPRQIKKIRFTGTSATARTFQAHNRKVGDWIIVSGALVADSLDNPYNGSFQINVVASAHEFSYAMQANPGAEPTGTMWLNRFSSHYVRVTSVSQSGNGPWTITLTTPTPHFRVPGQNILVQNMRRQSNPDVLSPISAPGVFHRVVDVPAPTVLRFIMTTDPGNDFYPAFATIGVSFQAWGINGGVAALGERNRVFGARFGGPYSDTWNTKDMVVLKNYYHAVVTGLYQNMGGFSGRGTDGSPTRPVTSLVREGADFKTARLTCDFIHGLAAGQAVLVAKAIVGGSPINPFNGNFSVEEVLSPIAFTYRMSAAPTDDAQQSPAPPVFGGIWQVDRIICNRNIFELVGPLADAGTPFGVGMGALGDFSPQYIFQELIAKRNLIRNVDGAVDLDSAGITAQWVKNATVEANTFAGVSRSPITYRVVENLRQFHNQTQAGEVIQGRLFSNDFSSSVYLNQVETDVDLGVAGGASTQK